MPSKTLLRNLRLVSGLVLMLFVIGHLANLALGLHSLGAMGAWRVLLLDPWRTPVGAGLLVLAAGVHTALGLYAIATRCKMQHLLTIFKVAWNRFGTERREHWQFIR